MGRPRKSEAGGPSQDVKKSPKKRRKSSCKIEDEDSDTDVTTSKRTTRGKMKRKSPEIKPVEEETKRKVKRKNSFREQGSSSSVTGKQKGTRQRVSKEKVRVKAEVHRSVDSVTPRKGGRKAKVKRESEESMSDSSLSSDSESEDEKTSKTKIKKMKRTSGSTMTGGGPATGHKFIGAHVSIAGGLYKAVHEAVDIGARAFGMFLKSQRQWNAKPMEEKQVEMFKEACREYKYSPHMIVPHGSYLLNLGAPNPETLQKSRHAFIDELQRSERLGLAIYNLHPGSTCGEITTNECIAKIAASINMAHQKTKYIVTVIENMCCQGGTIGGKFSDLAAIIKLVKDKARVGVCLDTCHAFAAGYDLSTDEGYKQSMQEFERLVHFKYLKAVHVNDSKGVCGCHLDRHENIGKGKLGIKTFTRIMNDSRFNNIPFVLETPGGKYDYEVKKLYSLIKK